MYNIAKHWIHPEGAVGKGYTQGPLQIWASALVTIGHVWWCCRPEETNASTERAWKLSTERPCPIIIGTLDILAVRQECCSLSGQHLLTSPLTHHVTTAPRRPTVVALCSPLLGRKSLEEFGCAVTLYSSHCQQCMKNKLGEANSCTSGFGSRDPISHSRCQNSGLVWFVFSPGFLPCYNSNSDDLLSK